MSVSVPSDHFLGHVREIFVSALLKNRYLIQANFLCPTGTAAPAQRCQEGRSMDLEPIMRLLALVTVFPFLVAPAFAQSSGQNQQQTQINPADTQTIQQQVRENLQQAGFTDIKIMPSSFLVRAKDSAGNPVMMVINPDSVTAVTEVPAGAPPSGASANPPSAQNSGAGIAGKPGSKSGPAVRPSRSTTGQGLNANEGGNESTGSQDAAKVPGLPGSKSGPATRPPSGSSPNK
jgi:hypothetical protein